MVRRIESSEMKVPLVVTLYHVIVAKSTTRLSAVHPCKISPSSRRRPWAHCRPLDPASLSLLPGSNKPLTFIADLWHPLRRNIRKEAL